MKVIAVDFSLYVSRFRDGAMNNEQPFKDYSFCSTFRYFSTRGHFVAPHSHLKLWTCLSRWIVVLGRSSLSVSERLFWSRICSRAAFSSGNVPHVIQPETVDRNSSSIILYPPANDSEA